MVPKCAPSPLQRAEQLLPWMPLLSPLSRERERFIPLPGTLAPAPLPSNTVPQLYGALLLQVLAQELPFDEVAMLEESRPHIERSVGLPMAVHGTDDGDAPEGIVDSNGPFPADPKFVLDVAAPA